MNKVLTLQRLLFDHRGLYIENTDINVKSSKQ